MRTDYRRIRSHDLFIVRIRNSGPTVWQKRGDQLRMLCGLSEPFNDSFACMQEWELNTHTNQHVVRLDFLHKIAMAPSTRYESPAFFQKYRAATLGGHNYAVRKEVQLYRSVDEFFGDSEMYQILSEFDFFATTRDESLHSAFKQLEDSPSMQPRVQIEELNVEAIPTAILSTDALETIHDLRRNRYLRRHEGNQSLWDLPFKYLFSVRFTSARSPAKCFRRFRSK